MKFLKNKNKNINSQKEVIKNKPSFFFEIFSENFLKNRPLFTKILYTLLLIVIFRIAASITIPGVSIKNNNFANGGNSFLGILNMLGGGGLSRLSIVALGIGPFITASIIMQLLQSEAFPPLYRLSKSGPAGKRKINVITRIITLFLAVMQGIALIVQFSNGGVLDLKPAFNKTIFKYFVLPIILVGGSMFSLFLGEQITKNGVGNGTSLLIFSGIVSNLLQQFIMGWKILSHYRDPLVYDAFGSSSVIDRAQINSLDTTTSYHNAIISFGLYFLSFWLMIFIMAYIYKAQRQIPIQQSGSGMTTDAKQMSRLPIKVNPSGVMPIIFPMILLTIPSQVILFYKRDPAGNYYNSGADWISKNLSLTSPLTLVILTCLIFLFSIAMSLVVFNPLRIAENFKKQGTFIPGIRPGEETEKYISGVVIRLSMFSGVYLSIITLIKYIMEIIIIKVTNFPSQIVSQMTFGGTSILILVSVSIETINQLQARDTTNKISRARKASIDDDGNNDMKGLLW